jgi:DNA-binding transcriptional LysR family regulator
VSVVSTAKYFIPRLLGAFCTEYPDVEVSLEVLNREGIVNRLRENLDDCYVMSMPPDDLAVEKRIFMANPLVVIAPSSHRLAGKGRATLLQLAQERFILRERGSGTRLACDAFFAAHNFQPTVRLELGSNEAIKQSVAGGMGLSVISLHALGEFYAADSLAVLNVDGFPIHSNWYSVTLQGKRLSPPALAFLEYLAAHSGEVEPGKKVPSKLLPPSRVRSTKGKTTGI